MRTREIGYFGAFSPVYCSLRAGKAPLRAFLVRMCDGFLSERLRWFGFDFARLVAAEYHRSRTQGKAQRA